MTCQRHTVLGKPWAQTASTGIQPWSLRAGSVHSRPASPHCSHEGAAAPQPWPGASLWGAPTSLCGDLVASRQGAPDSVAGPGAEGEVHRLLQPTHRFSKITIGCIYTFLKNRKSGNTPSFWAGQLPALPHPSSRPHMLIHVTLGLQEPCAFETTGGSPARRPGWQGPPTSALLTVSIRPSWPKVPGPLLQGHAHARTRTHTSARGALPVPLWSVRGTRARPEPLRPPQSGLAGGAAEHGMEPQADPQPGRGRGTGVP